MKKEKNKFDFEAFAKEAAEQLKAGKSMVGAEGVFTPLLKKIIEASLEGELDTHLSRTRIVENNKRNGHNRKNIQSPLGGFEIFSPRDRNASFEPRIIEKRQRSISSDIDNQIIALYGRGMSYSDIQMHLAELYGIDVSDGTISAITNPRYNRNIIYSISLPEQVNIRFPGVSARTACLHIHCMVVYGLAHLHTSGRRVYGYSSCIYCYCCAYLPDSDNAVWR